MQTWQAMNTFLACYTFHTMCIVDDVQIVHNVCNVYSVNTACIVYKMPTLYKVHTLSTSCNMYTLYAMWTMCTIRKRASTNKHKEIDIVKPRIVPDGC